MASGVGVDVLGVRSFRGNYLRMIGFSLSLVMIRSMGRQAEVMDLGRDAAGIWGLGDIQGVEKQSRRARRD